MKKITVILVLIVVLSTGIAFADTYVAKVPDFDVHLNGTEIDNIHSTYPLLVYNDITYFPMTWEYGTGLGLNLDWSFENGLIIDKSNDGNRIMLEQDFYNVPGTEHLVDLVTGRVVINGVEIDNSKEEYPLLIYRDITYFPLTWKFAVDAFGWNYEWSFEDGLIISTDYYDGKIYPIDYLDYVQRVEAQTELWNTELIEYGTEYTFNNGDHEYLLVNENNTGIMRYEWQEGDVFVGEVERDKFIGKGAYYYRDGAKYVGDFYKGHFTGFGKLDYSPTILGEAGYFLDDYIVSQSEGLKSSKVFKQMGTQPMVVLITEFSDIKKTTTDETWLGLFNETKTYYETSSLGKLSFDLIDETQGENNGVITITLDSPHPRFGAETSDRNMTIALESIEKALEYFDLEQYDTNKNGVIETYELHIVNVVAGYEESDGIIYDYSVFAHHQPLTGYDAAFDGYQLGGYLQTGELHFNEHLSKMTSEASFGVFAHEVGHSLGLPDLYDTDYSSEGIGPYSLMSHGMNLSDDTTKYATQPADLDAWSKEKLGFIEPTIITKSGEYKFYDQVFKIFDGAEYYLIENRLSRGIDEGLSEYGEGILVWKIQPDVLDEKYFTNTVNDDETNKGVDLIEANEKELKFSQLDTSDQGVYNHYFTKDSLNTLDTSVFKMTVLGDSDYAEVLIELK